MCNKLKYETEPESVALDDGVDEEEADIEVVCGGGSEYSKQDVKRKPTAGCLGYLVREEALRSAQETMQHCRAIAYLFCCLLLLQKNHQDNNWRRGVIYEMRTCAPLISQTGHTPISTP
ncbi:hypothetical protein CBL_14352 [Carabus blaptoides fortunei]